MKSFACLTVVAAFLCWNAPHGVAQQVPGRATLEPLVNSPDSQSAPVVPAAAESGGKRPAGIAARPKDGVSHPDLDTAWAEYDQTVAKVAESIKAAILKQFNAAAEKGDLDTAERWQTALENFAKAGDVPSELETKGAVSAAVADYKKAKDELGKAYETVVKTLTMEKKIAEAKAIRAELRALELEPVVSNDGKNGAMRSKEQSMDAGVKWTVLFRSSNPAFWNKQINSGDSYAVPIRTLPKGIRFLRLTRKSDGAFVIIEMTNDQLEATGPVNAEFGWSGKGEMSWGGYHLGIYGLNMTCRVGDIAIATLGSQLGDRPGWGFGHKTGVNDGQYCTWAGNVISPTIFEIAVKCGDLNAYEKKCLLLK
jgi:hypothetical protein